MAASGDLLFTVLVVAVCVALAAAGLLYSRWGRSESLDDPSSATIANTDFGWLLGMRKLRSGRAKAKQDAEALRQQAADSGFAFRRQFERDLKYVEDAKDTLSK